MKTIKPPFAIAIAIAIFFLQACYCLGSPIPYIICQRADGSTYAVEDDLWGYDNCGMNGDTEIGQSYTYPTPAPPVNPLGNMGGNNLVAPSFMNCNALALTSPLSGLPNGTVTFYWDALPGASAYRINLYDHNGTFLASFNSQAAATSLSADVSWGAIGGQYDIRVELVAFGSGGASCRETVTIPREAPSGGFSGSGGGNNGGGGGNNGGGGAPAATPTLTCSQDPRPECVH